MNSVSITGGGYTAQISLLGGQLLELTHHEDELIVPAGMTEGAFAGAVLAPWPNRTRAGSYSYHGVEHVLPVNEEATGAALHGLLIDLQLDVISQKESEVQLTGWLERSEGYPFGLDIALTYRVSADLGLSATLMARYRPEELAEADSSATEAHVVELEDGERQDEDAEDLDASDADSEDIADAAELDDESFSADQDESDAAQDGTGGDDAADDDTSYGDTSSDEAHASGPVEHELAVSASAFPDFEDEDAVEEDADDDTDSDDMESDDADASETEAPDADASETDAPAAEAAPASVPQTAPFGAGFHPYLTAGGAPLDECRLRLPARTMLTTKADGTVTGRKTVSGDFDLTTAPLLAGRAIDHAFTDLPHEGWTAELIHSPSGFVVRMIADSPWAQVYTGERIDRFGVAVEPMSCPPNALNSGEDLIHLEPGTWFRMGYSIEAIRAD